MNTLKLNTAQNQLLLAEDEPDLRTFRALTNERTESWHLSATISTPISDDHPRDGSVYGMSSEAISRPGPPSTEPTELLKVAIPEARTQRRPGTRTKARGLTASEREHALALRTTTSVVPEPLLQSAVIFFIANA